MQLGIGNADLKDWNNCEDKIQRQDQVKYSMTASGNLSIIREEI